MTAYPQTSHLQQFGITIVRSLLRSCVAALLLVAPVAWAAPPASFRGLANINHGQVIWASGTEATVLRSTDRGQSWITCHPPPDSSALDFRGLFAWDADHAIVMSAGSGLLSRIFETTDGCRSWSLLFTNPDAQGFFDSLTFNPTHPASGVLLGDPVAGRFTIFRSSDCGRHWTRDSSAALAGNPAGEGAFAASNSSLTFLPGTGNFFFATGGLGGARIFRFDAHANAWTVQLLPGSEKKATSGIFSVACRDKNICIAVGGDYKRPESRAANAFLTTDGGQTWQLPAMPPNGYRSAVAWDRDSHSWCAAGPGGIDLSSDDGQTWHAFGNEGNWNVLSLPWAAGPKGHLSRLNIPQH